MSKNDRAAVAADPSPAKRRTSRDEPRLSLWSRAYDRLLDCLAIGAGLAILGQAVSISLHVVLRLLGLSGVPLIVAVNEWSMVYVTFLGAAWLQREKGHVAMDGLVNGAPAHVRKGLILLALAIGVAVSSVIFWYSTQEVVRMWHEGARDFFKEARVPLVAIMWTLPFGMALLVVQLTRDMIAVIRNGVD